MKQHMKNIGKLTENQVLQDSKANGKERPWRAKKMKTLIVANSFQRLGEDKKATRIRLCGTYLEFTKYPDTGEQHLTNANFCRDRLCPMCQWRRSLRAFYEVSNVMDEMQLKHKDLIPLFLTITVRNCKAEIPEMTETLDKIFKGWHEFLKNRKIQRTVKGWFRALELTYNKERKEFHPHIHAIIFVNKNYFKKNEYIAINEWVQYWKSAMRIDYNPICDIRKIKNSEKKRKEIAEVAKYTVKDSDFATADNALTDNLVYVLSKTLKGRRLYAFGGLLKQIAASFEQYEDLIRTEKTTIRQDVATVIERYSWRFGFANYIRRRDDPVSDVVQLAQESAD